MDGKVSLLVKDFGFTCSQSGPRPDVYFHVFSKSWICDIWILKFFLPCYIFLTDTSSRTQVCIIWGSQMTFGAFIKVVRKMEESS